MHSCTNKTNLYSHLNIFNNRNGQVVVDHAGHAVEQIMNVVRAREEKNLTLNYGIFLDKAKVFAGRLHDFIFYRRHLYELHNFLVRVLEKKKFKFSFKNLVRKFFSLLYVKNEEQNCIWAILTFYLSHITLNLNSIH